MMDAPGAGLAAPQIGVGLRVFTYASTACSATWSTRCSTSPRGARTAPRAACPSPACSFDTTRARPSWHGAQNMYGRAGRARGHRAARPVRPARDRPPRRDALRRPARPGDAQGGDAGRSARRSGSPRARYRRSRHQPARDLRPGDVTCESSSPAPPRRRCPSLEALAASSHELVAVVTRPDAPAGRGRRSTPSPVRRRAEELGLPVLTPLAAKDPDVPRRAA